ncbi:hypothetical protein HHX48_11815 [Salinimonas sp. HHU 13199]|uniref:Uncharacterized protein n=1 Tax=Salinimonas profundi TaxID=2729140 RepID=A0ABR8LJQ5_9ALTE|nr:hypothetical protein [Salinimonas profundi]MBD3586426.1 hypothetical protein [Salinimonas profundi]
MGIQAIVKTTNFESIELALGATFSQIEVFPLDNGLFGVSIPTKVVDTLGEYAIFEQLAKLEHYELWSGEWRKPKSRWKFW